jgi:protein-disulfide isomerase
MANKRVAAQPGRKSGTVKQSKKTSTSNRAFYLLAAGLGVAGIVALTYQSTRPKGVAAASPVDTTLPPVQSEGYVLGNPAAAIEVVEFGDFECPQCGRFATLTEPDVRTRLINAGAIRYRYIDYPLPMHGNTWNASRAAACADEQGKFWEMHDAIYANQDRWDTQATNKPDKLLKQIGGQIPGIKADQFDQCVDTKKTQAKVQAHLKIAEARHINATPTFSFASDKQIDGFLTYDQFKAFVDQAIAKAGKQVPSAGGDTAKKAAPLTPAKKGE